MGDSFEKRPAIIVIKRAPGVMASHSTSPVDFSSASQLLQWTSPVYFSSRLLSS